MKHLKILRPLFVLVSLVTFASCSTEQAPLAPAAPEALDLSSLPIAGDSSQLLDDGLLGGVLKSLHLLQCRPLPYASESRWIGFGGGSISVGPHTLTIPAGALSRNVWITAEIISDDVNSIRFSPEGLEFSRKATLSMSYANCDIVGILLPKQIVYTTEGLRILELIPSLDDLLRRRTTGRIDHFSRYAVGW